MNPDVSVIIPTYNSATTLRETLRSLEAARFDRERVEIVVADDGSTDDTAAALAEFAPRLPLRVVVRDRSKGCGAAVARNDALAVARGRVIAFTDADCVVDAGWVEAAREAVIGQGNAIVSGETWCDEAVIFPWKMSPAGQRGITANLAFDRERIGDVRFSTDYEGVYGEDTQFVMDAAARGFAMADVPAMRVWHPARRMPLRSVLRRTLWRGNEVLLVKRFGRAAFSSFHPLFRPTLFGRVSPATVTCVAALAVLVGALGFPVLVVPLLLVATVLVEWFLVSGYRRCVMYRPAGTPIEIPLADRLRTLVAAVAYVPYFVFAHVRGSIRFRHFLL